MEERNKRKWQENRREIVSSESHTKHDCLTNWLVWEECCKYGHVWKQLFLLQLVYVCLSKWGNLWMGERMNEIVLCVCEQKTVCMLDGERSTLHDTDECTYATLVHVGSNRQCHAVWDWCDCDKEKWVLISWWGVRTETSAALLSLIWAHVKLSGLGLNRLCSLNSKYTDMPLNLWHYTWCHALLEYFQYLKSDVKMCLFWRRLFQSAWLSLALCLGCSSASVMKS